MTAAAIRGVEEVSVALADGTGPVVRIEQMWQLLQPALRAG
ncbi:MULTISPECIES: hypothetical protein [Rhodococcus]|nr:MULTISPECIES: hypothetical protein [Rhodococcus]WFS10901.1 hypothetical protein P9K37_13750 [Rhodococcus aetherivorans]